METEYTTDLTDISFHIDLVKQQRDEAEKDGEQFYQSRIAMLQAESLLAIAERLEAIEKQLAKDWN